MDGREKCELLNSIRQKIAEKNDIEFVVYDCTFEGECTGTCPKCESEIKYLEKELEKKQARGEKINLIGIFDEKPETCVRPDYGPDDFYHGDLVGDIAPSDDLSGDLIDIPMGKIEIPEKYQKREDEQ